MRKVSLYTAFCLLLNSFVTFAGDFNSFSHNEKLKKGLFFGVGGGYNSIKFDQYLKTGASSDIFSDTTLVAFGASGGSQNPYHSTQSTFVPDGQMGYFKKFTNSDQLFGVKFLYNYLGMVSTENDISSSSPGTFTKTAIAPNDASYQGNVVVKSSQTSINHELALLAFIGHSFSKSHVYLGGGPALFGTHSNLYDAIGYVDLNGLHLNVAGNPTSFSSSKWLLGGAAQMGITYYLNPTWFLDFSYTYAITNLYANNYSGSFQSTTPSEYPLQNIGTLGINSSQRVSSQGVTVAISKVFSLF